MVDTINNSVISLINNSIKFQTPEFFKKKYRPVVSFSGGPDSVLLVHYVHNLYKQKKIEKPILFHLNHKLRGIESNSDEDFCIKTAQKFNLPIIVSHLKVNRTKKINNEILVGYLKSLKKKFFYM
jgi:tRNA(Ile)-lysidine synthase